MSTRCNIVVTDGKNIQYFYRHSDGYPEGVRETLTEFIKKLRSGNIRDNTMQSAGWIVILGYEEYKKENEKYAKLGFPSIGMEWKVGAYEPSTGICSTAEFVYVIDLKKKACYVGGGDDDDTYEYDFGKWNDDYKNWPKLEDVCTN